MSILTLPHYQTTEAAGGKQALELISSHPFDLVILDVVMPDLDGLQVLEAIRREYSESELPVIMATWKGETDHVVRALELGANDYVTKPIELPVLLARSKVQISRKRAEDALRAAHADLERRVASRTAELVKTNQVLRAEVAERRQVERALRKNRETLQLSEQRYRAFYDYTPSMFFTIEPNGVLVSANSFAAEHLGHSVEGLVGMPAVKLYDPGGADVLNANLQACLDEPGRLHRVELKMVRSNGEAIWVRQTARLVEDTDHVRRILVVCEDITEAHALAEQLSYQASHDELTGLLNRRAFQHLLRDALDTARSHNAQHALCYLDLDQFKVINDTCGHIAGDELLRQLGRWLQERVRPSDTLARLGGDEFGVLLERCSLERAMRVADALRKAIEDFRFQWENKTFRIGVSIGLVPITRSTPSITSLLSTADTACYAAKEEGRNRIHAYRDDDLEIAKRHTEMEWVARINRALEESRFRLYAQPIVSLGDRPGAVRHYELLLQMRDEDGQSIGPESFLPAAERYNVCTKVDRWVIATAFAWLADHRRPLDRAGHYAINLSGQSLGDQGFLKFIIEQLDRRRIPAHKICFEVTETAAIANLSSAASFMSSLKERGCLFALDDFGSGLSSFAYLKTLPVDYLKIDGTFVRNIVDSPIDFAMVKAINEIARVMGKQTVAEFVENQEILQRVRQAGVDYAQGIGVGRPHPLEELA